jgi:hypothetical protein
MSTAGGASAGRNASVAPACNVAGVEVEPVLVVCVAAGIDPASDPISGACSRHAPSTKDKANRPVVVR